MKHSTFGLPFAVVAVAAVVVTGCVSADPTLPPPIVAVPPASRIRVAVPPTRNESPLAVVAELTAETNRMLVAVLERTGRFVADDGAAFRLETSITAVRDEDAGEGVVYREAEDFGLRRRAVVEMSYRVVDGAGRTVVRGSVAGDEIALGRREVPTPRLTDLETGAYWNSTLGRATRACLDAMVREITESS